MLQVITLSKGGFTDNHKLTSNCEVFNTETNKIESIGHVNFPASNLSLCSYNDTHIFKFGGRMHNNELCQVIEKYSIKDDEWQLLNPKIRITSFDCDFRLLSNSASVQINQNQILIFGGYYENNSNSN